MMPWARAADGARVSFERHDPPDRSEASAVLVGLAAMGTTGRLYADAIQLGLEAGYTIVIVEHRSTDQVARRSWSTSLAADDVLAVLDEVGAQRAHISGASLGAMVAQEVAIRHPARTAGLVLTSTTGGWPRVDFHPPQGAAMLARSVASSSRGGESLERRVERAMSVWFSKEFAARTTPGSAAWERLASILGEGVGAETRRAQLWAAARHSTWRRLSRIRAPTLIQHGGRDRLISPRAGIALARRIPDSSFHLWPTAGHALGIEIPHQSYSLALDFLSQQDHLLSVQGRDPMTSHCIPARGALSRGRVQLSLDAVEDQVEPSLERHPAGHPVDELRGSAAGDRILIRREPA
jgi:pimeloyl-ACP methyl ester carboxylesterase